MIRRAVAIDVGRPVAVALSGKRLRVLWAAEETIRLYENVEGASPRDDVFPAPARVSALAFSPSGGFAVVACDDGSLRSLNAGTGEFGLTLATGGLPAMAVAMAADQGPVVAAFPDGSVRRYDLATGMSDIVGIGSGIRLVAVTPDGGAVIAAGADGVLLRWKPSLSPLPDFLALGTTLTAIAADGAGDKVLAAMTTGRLWLHHFTGGGPAIEFGYPAPPDAESSSAPVPPATAAPSSSGFRAIADEDVRFTVYRPQALSPGVWASLLVFAHKTDLVIQPGRAPVDPNKQVEDMARTHFGDVPVRRASEDARGAVFRGARLCVAADLPGIRCDPDEAGFDWQEPVHQVVFRLLAGPDLVGSVVRGAVRVWCGPLLLGEVSLAISITACPPEAGPPAVTDSAPRYRKIFPSYSHDDRAIVDGFAEVARALGDQYLQDVLALRSGEPWRARLAELIAEADIFQLFWSSHSMRSQYCREEWEHALALGRPSFVRPLYWEDPLPEDPVMGLPPIALKELQFVKVRPYLIRSGTPASSDQAPDTSSGGSAQADAGPADASTPPGLKGLDAQGEVREALRTAVASYGQRVLNDPHVLGNLVADLLPDLPRERSLLTAGAEAGIAAEMMRYVHNQHIDPDTAVRLAARTLAERRAIDPAASMWVASEYAQALGFRGSPVNSVATVFISYAHADDTAWTAKLAADLERDGFNVFFDRWDIAPGDQLVRRLDEALSSASCGLIVFGRSTADSPWVYAEYSALVQRMEVSGARLIPVLLDDVPLPPILGMQVFADFRYCASESQYQSCLAQLEQALRGERAARIDADSVIRFAADLGRRPEGPRRVKLTINQEQVRIQCGQGEAVRSHGGPGHRVRERLWHVERTRRRLAATQLSPGSALSGPGLSDLLLLLGQAMGDQFLAGAVGELLEAELTDADRQNAALQIALEISDDKELRALPWETICLKGRVQPLVLHPRTQMYHFVSGLGSTPAISIPGPLRVLAVIANPEHSPGEMLDYEAELNRILRAVDRARRKERVLVRVLDWGSAAAIRTALREARYHILHISCQARPGVLMLETEDGDPDPVDAGRFIDEVLVPDHGVPLVVLAGRATAAGPETDSSDQVLPDLAKGLLAHGVPAVLAMTSSVSDHYAIQLASHFYQALASRQQAPDPLAALSDARRELERARTDLPPDDPESALAEWWMPALYLRTQPTPLFKPDPPGAVSPAQVADRPLTGPAGFQNSATSPDLGF
jgi:hypothetical protein